MYIGYEGQIMSCYQPRARRHRSMDMHDPVMDYKYKSDMIAGVGVGHAATATTYRPIYLLIVHNLTSICSNLTQ